MRMVKADQAHQITTGSKKVRVGVMDTGVQADHPDIHPNFDYKLSRNFVTDIPSFDGPCEHASCVDPIGEDDGGHGTHVAGTIAASLNGFGVSGVAPERGHRRGARGPGQRLLLRRSHARRAHLLR